MVLLIYYCHNQLHGDNILMNYALQATKAISLSVKFLGTYRSPENPNISLGMKRINEGGAPEKIEIKVVSLEKLK